MLRQDFRKDESGVAELATGSAPSAAILAARVRRI